MLLLTNLLNFTFVKVTSYFLYFSISLTLALRCCFSSFALSSAMRLYVPLFLIPLYIKFLAIKNEGFYSCTLDAAFCWCNVQKDPLSHCKKFAIFWPHFFLSLTSGGQIWERNRNCFYRLRWRLRHFLLATQIYDQILWVDVNLNDSS